MVEYGHYDFVQSLLPSVLYLPKRCALMCGVNIFSQGMYCGNNDIEYYRWPYCMLPYGTAGILQS